MLPPEGTKNPTKPQLTVDLITETALSQMREVGYDGVTMRSIATALGTGPASLYAHVANRRALDLGMVEGVLGQISVPRYVDGQEGVKAMLLAMLEKFRDYPGVARAAMGDIPATEPSLRITEFLLDHLVRSGATPPVAVWMANFLLMYVSSFAFIEGLANKCESRGSEHDPAAQAALFASLPDEFPSLKAYAMVIAECRPEDWFEKGIDLLLLAIRS